MAVTETKTNGSRITAVAGRIGILILVAVSFMVGLLGAVYLSLRSPEVAVPEVVGKDQSAGRSLIEEAGLNLRVRATRFAPDAPANTILDQSPRPGEIIKVGQTIAVVVARSERREGEANSTAESSPNARNSGANSEEESAAAANSANTSSSNRNASNTNTDRRRDRDDRNSNRNANRSGTERNANRDANRNTNANRNVNRNSNAAGNANRTNNSARPGNANRATPIVRPTPPAANGARPRTTNTNRP